MRKMAATSDPENVARAFIDARAGKTPLTAYPGAMPQTMAEAYAIQDRAIALDGRRVGGLGLGHLLEPPIEEVVLALPEAALGKGLDVALDAAAQLVHARRLEPVRVGRGDLVERFDQRRGQPLCRYQLRRIGVASGL